VDCAKVVRNVKCVVFVSKAGKPQKLDNNDIIKRENIGLSMENNKS
jgi:hypothetical protein